jgi:aryl carrier-like protein
MTSTGTDGRTDGGRERPARERALSEVFARVLKLSTVAPDTDFFAAGGDSLRAAMLIAGARRSGVAVTLEQILHHPTPRGLAAVAGACGSAAAPALAPAAASAAASAVAPASAAGRTVGSADRDAPLLPFQSDWLCDGAERADTRALGMLVESRHRLDPAALAAALAAVVAHHDGLRLRLARGSGRWRQRVVPHESAPMLTVVPLSLTGEGAQTAVQEHADRLAASVDVREGPLVHAVLFPGLSDAFPGAAAPDRLLVVIHHFGVDAVSFGLFLEDLETAYGQILAGEPVALPPCGTSVVGLARLLAAYPDSPTGRAEARYWAGQAARVPALDPRRPRTTVADRSGAVSVAVDRATTAALHDVRAPGNRGIEAVLGCLAYAFRRVTGTDVFCARLTHHGRTQLPERVDLSRTIGWITTQVPVIVDLGGAMDLDAVIRTTRSALAALPSGGLGYFPLAQWLPGTAGERVRSVRRNIDLTVNVEREAAPADDTLLRPAAVQPRFFQGHVAAIPSLAVYGQERIGAGATYVWKFDPRRHDGAVVADLAEAHRAALDAVARGRLLADR